MKQNMVIVCLSKVNATTTVNQCLLSAQPNSTQTLFHEESSHMEVLCKKRCSQNSQKKHQLPACKFIQKRIR